MMLVVAVLWGGNHVVIRMAHKELDLTSLVFGRWLLTFVLLLPWCLSDIHKSREILLQHRGKLVQLSILTTVFFSFAILGAPFYTNAVNVGLLQASTPVWILLFSWVTQQQRVAPLQALGVLVGMAGAVAIVSQGDVYLLASLGIGFGDLLALVAAWLWALYSVQLSKLPVRIKPMTLLTLISGIGVVVLAPIFAINITLGNVGLYGVGLFNSLDEVADMALWAFLYVALGGTLVGNLFYNIGVARLGPPTAGVMLYLAPACAAIFGYFLLEESLHFYHLAGMLLVITGIYMANDKEFKLEDAGMIK